MIEEWQYRVKARYAGARLFYANNKYRRRSYAIEAAQREQREAEETGYAVRITVYCGDKPLAAARTMGRE